MEGAVQIPHPLEDFDNQIPSSPGWQRCQMPGVCPGGGGMLKLGFDQYISVSVQSIPNRKYWFFLELSVPHTRPPFSHLEILFKIKAPTSASRLQAPLLNKCLYSNSPRLMYWNSKMTPMRLSSHAYFYIWFGFICPQVSSWNCETMETWKMCNFFHKASESCYNLNILSVGYIS